MARRTYSDDEKAVALAAYEANGKKLDRAAKFADVPRNTLRRWVNGEAVSEEVATLCDSKRADLAQRLEETAHRLLDEIPAALFDATLQQIAVSLGIIIDKCLALRAKPDGEGKDAATDSIGELSDDDLNRRIAATQARIAALAAGTTPPPVSP